MGSNVYRTDFQLSLMKCVYRLTFSHLLLTVCQGIRVSETQEFRSRFFYFSRSPQNLSRIDDTIKAYKGSSQDPRWIDREPGHPLNR